jgi:malonyl-CoA/methylmalonyl-CoA synthetase
MTDDLVFHTNPMSRGRLARLKQPRRLFFVDALPRNATGKVQKADLRARFEDAFKTG